MQQNILAGAHDKLKDPVVQLRLYRGAAGCILHPDGTAHVLVQLLAVGRTVRLLNT